MAPRRGCARCTMEAKPASRGSKSGALARDGDLPSRRVRVYRRAEPRSAGVGSCSHRWLKQATVIDLIVAGTALAHNLVLMTDNRKDFPMPQLALYALP